MERSDLNVLLMQRGVLCNSGLNFPMVAAFALTLASGQ